MTEPIDPNALRFSRRSKVVAALLLAVVVYLMLFGNIRGALDTWSIYTTAIDDLDRQLAKASAKLEPGSKSVEIIQSLSDDARSGRRARTFRVLIGLEDEPRIGNPTP